jgi:hypothetical protein
VLVVSAVVGAYANYHSTNIWQGNENKPTYPVSNSTVPAGENNTATPQPSITPDPTPVILATQPPLITPAPTSLLPDDCRIEYRETSKSYDKDVNITQIAFNLEVIPDMSTRRTFALYPHNFYLKENDAAISIINTNGTSEGILLNENYRQNSNIVIEVAGNYTGNNYELSYYNPPDILLIWKKLT